MKTAENIPTARCLRSLPILAGRKECGIENGIIQFPALNLKRFESAKGAKTESVKSFDNSNECIEEFLNLQNISFSHQNP